MVRPSQDVLDHFYGLADCDDTKRLKSVAAIVNNVKSHAESRDYCMERLIGGLCSARGASRIGYAAALTHSLAGEAHWTLKKIVEQMEKSLDLSDREMAHNNSIGHHLVYACLLDSGAFKKETSSIMEKQLALSSRFSFLSLSIGDVIACALLQMTVSDVKKQAWSTLKPALKGASLKPEMAYLCLKLKKHAGSLLAESVPYVSADGNLKWSDISETFLIDLLKGMDKGIAYLFIKQWLIAAKEDGQWENGFTKVLKWAKRDEHTATERLLRVTEVGLTLADNAKQVSSLASALTEKVKGLGEGTSAQDLYPILVSLEQAHVDAFVKARTMEKILERMDEEHVKLYVTKCISSPSSLRRLLSVFPQWPTINRKTALNALFALAKETESSVDKKKERDDIFATLTQCIDSLFKIKVKGGEQASASLSEENEEMIMKMAKKGEDGWKNAEKTIKGMGGELARCLLVLYGCLSLWKRTSPDEEEKKEYGETMKEVITIAKNGDTEENNLVLVDLLVSLLGHSRRFHRTLVCFVFSPMLPNAKEQWAEHLVKVITSSDAELAGDKGEEEEEEIDEEGDEEMESEEEGEDEDEEESEEDDDLANMGEVDTEMVEKLKAALGKAAVTEEEEDSGAESDGVDDEVMFKLDQGLVEAFKNIGGAQARSAVASRFAKPLRMRVCDLLLFTVSSKETPDNVKISFILPLLRATKKMVIERKNEDSTKKLIELVNIMAHLKKVSADEKIVLSIVSQIEKESLTTTNPFIHDIMASITGFLCSLLCRPSLSPTAHSAFIALFDRFVKQDTNGISAPLASAAMATCPIAFGNDTKTFLKIAFDEDVRIFRRTEALQCTLSLTRKDVLRNCCGAAKRAGKTLGPLAAHALTFNGKKEEVKPRFMAMLLKLIFQLADNEEAKTALSPVLTPVLESLLSRETEIFKGSGPLSKCNSACQRAANRSALSLIQGINKKLQ
ncbi:hypothetical protein PRIPAC_92669 [Pristionchus pacificus]|uniref:Uncharacterized protein n=1 Tax=Pristionchus pacificus TaxID=54126 RepID=A0A2A6BJ42_PRIPA|nr:hypothetical protein PRIPAC_92669 [Pristionchus pacificus]|eukprot:PDM65907.1 hypothetical protein PRIPAC_44186 [Pristionchus pacificus]